MKTRKHHNNKGNRQIKRGKTVEQVKRIAKSLNIPYDRGNNDSEPFPNDIGGSNDITYGM